MVEVLSFLDLSKKRKKAKDFETVIETTGFPVMRV